MRIPPPSTRKRKWISYRVDWRKFRIRLSVESETKVNPASCERGLSLICAKNSLIMNPNKIGADHLRLHAAEQKWSDTKVIQTKLVRFQSRIDADSGVKVYRITSCSYWREADPRQFSDGSKGICYLVNVVSMNKLSSFLSYCFVIRISPCVISLCQPWICKCHTNM